MRFLSFGILGLLLNPATVLAGEPSVQPERQELFLQLDRNGDGSLAVEEVEGKHARLFARLLRTADADADGRLSPNEFATGLQAQRPEKPLTEKQPSRLPGADELLLLVAMADVDADGVLSADEVPERLLPFYRRLEERLGGGETKKIRAREIARAAPGLSQFALATVKRLQIDVDLEYGLLPDKNWVLVQRLESPRRPGEVLANTEQALEFFRVLDTDGDGQIVYEEVPAVFAARFDRLLDRADRDGDRKISQREMRRLSRRVKAIQAMGFLPKQDPEAAKQAQESPPRGE